MNADLPIISLAICTRNRATQLSRALRAVFNIKCLHKWELIIINNGSTDNTKIIVEQLMHASPVNILYKYEPKQGGGNAHNAALGLCRSGFIAFIDDDCYPNEDFLENILFAFSEFPDVAFVGGKVLLFDPTDRPITIQLCEEQVFISPGSVIEAGFIQGANYAFITSALRLIGGFDPSFGHGASFSCEDIDVLARLSAIGFAGLYDPRIIVSHHHGRKTLIDEQQLMRLYDVGRGAYYAKCLLNHHLRRKYASFLLLNLFKEPINTRFFEIKGAFCYLARAIYIHGNQYHNI